MTTTFINTNALPRQAGGAGEGSFSEIINQALCGAENVRGALRWLEKGDTLKTSPESADHQLIYLMDGEGVITLDSKDVAVMKGAGIYLGPKEWASVRQTGTAPLKLFHLVVPKANS